MRALMEWIQNYQLFLFDLDGLLVNTESLHYLAYKMMLQSRGYQLPWNFQRYCMTAHYHSDRIEKELLEIFPSLYDAGDSWEKLYAEKKNFIANLLKQGTCLMPGVQSLLTQLEAHHIPCCVVTHSADELVSIIRQQHPILDRIPFWVTRHQYTHPKPHPECYFRAIEKYAKPTDQVIGFEDSPRGLKALMETRAKPILICEVDYPEIPEFIKKGATHHKTLLEMQQQCSTQCSNTCE